MVGQTVSSYQIVEKLGEGGMGIVYKALDVRLERFVALKFLKSEDINEDRKRRFLQEARSVSALNHPSIIQVYDIGQHEGLGYIAMEFVEGSTLQAVTQRGPLPVDEALQYAIQIADAMSAAHAAGIVHRDLKPGNIIITPRKQVKVLDFGLAKLNALTPEVDRKAPESSDTQLSPLKAVYTVAGMIVGSLSYMAPEQALSQPVDARSDIFAFGLLLYEMLAGQPAFAGSKFEVLSAIVHSEPKPLNDLVPGISPQLVWVIAHCLRKDPERRFQSMAEIKVALQDLRSESSSSNLSRSLLLPHIAPPSRPTASLRDPLRGWLLLSNAVLLLICLSAGLWILHRHNQPEPQMAQLTRLTTESGLNIDPAISPDGEFVAYASDRSGEGNLDIWVRQIGGSEAVRLTHDSGDEDQPAFSPDGTQIAFHSERDGSGLYLISTLGGSERRIADGGRDPKFSPDGTQIAYWKGPRNPYPLRAGSADLYIVDLATSTTRRIRSDFAAALYPVWSPDGKRILFVGLKVSGDDTTYNWWTTPLDGSPALMCGRMIDESSVPIPAAWQGDTIYFTNDAAPPAYIGAVKLNQRTWQPVVPGRRLTTATTAEDRPSISNNGNIVFASLSDATNLFTVPVDANTGKTRGNPSALTRDVGYDAPGSLSSDGRKFAFTTDRTGNAEVWLRDMATGQERQLTYGGVHSRSDPLISPDGSQVAWQENHIANPIAFITPSQGGISHTTCDQCQHAEVWSADGNFLLCRSGRSPSWLDLLNVSTGRYSVYMKEATLGLRGNSLTSDGKWAAFTVYRAPRDYSIYAAPFSLSQSPPRSSWIELLRSPDADPNAVWSPNGTLLLFSSSRDGFNCLWGLHVDKQTKQPRGAPFPVRHFHSPSQVLASPNFFDPVVLGSDRILAGVRERSGSIWMMNPNH